MYWGGYQEDVRRTRQRQLTEKIIDPTVDTEPATYSSAKGFKMLTILRFFQTAGNEVRRLELLNIEADPAAEEAEINASCAKIFATGLVSTAVRRRG